jgi:structural maintenance of chromosome 3 (chondroitin sulfate proteoglycan 6)
VLDQRKDELIERTFKQVAEYFQDIFRELVPQGRAQLIMQRRTDEDKENQLTDSGKKTKPIRRQKGAESIDNYVGVSIRVSYVPGMFLGEDEGGG